MAYIIMENMTIEVITMKVKKPEFSVYLVLLT